MGGTLRVDMAMLGQTGSQLSALSDAFSATSSLEPDDKSAIGASSLTSAFESFATNWSQKRKGIQESLESVAKMATQAHQAYQTADQDMTNALRKGNTAADTPVAHGAS